VGDALTIGMNPGSNFENAYLYASGKGAGVGTIGTQDLKLDMTTLSGTVTNNTEYDFSYLMLAAENSVLVLPELKAGQTVDIADAIAGGDVVFQYNTEFWDDVYYSFVGDYYGSSGTEIDEELAAVLYTGVTSIKQRVTDSGSIIVAGAVRDYDRATTGNCAEISYGCFYTVAEQEVSDAAD
jgi:hypothetical protein